MAETSEIKVTKEVIARDTFLQLIKGYTFLTDTNLQKTKTTQGAVTGVGKEALLEYAQMAGEATNKLWETIHHLGKDKPISNL